MPCNAIAYLPATIRQLDTTAIFANNATAELTAQMLAATLTAMRNNDYVYTANYGTHIIADITEGTVRIWRDGEVVIRLYDTIRNPEQITAAIWQAIAATLASLTQIITAQTIGEFVPVTDTQFVGNNLVLTVNL